MRYKYHTVTKKTLGDLNTPVSTYLRVRDAYPQSVLMESSDYHSGENAKSFIALHPIAQVSIEHGMGKAIFPDGATKERPIKEDADSAEFINESFVNNECHR